MRHPITLHLAAAVSALSTAAPAYADLGDQLEFDVTELPGGNASRPHAAVAGDGIRVIAGEIRIGNQWNPVAWVSTGGEPWLPIAIPHLGFGGVNGAGFHHDGGPGGGGKVVDGVGVPQPAFWHDILLLPKLDLLPTLPGGQGAANALAEDGSGTAYLAGWSLDGAGVRQPAVWERLDAKSPWVITALPGLENGGQAFGIAMSGDFDRVAGEVYAAPRSRCCGRSTPAATSARMT